VLYELNTPRRLLGYTSKSVKVRALTGYAGTMAYSENTLGTNYLAIINPDLNTMAYKDPMSSSKLFQTGTGFLPACLR
jgi:hypothetical protein